MKNTITVENAKAIIANTDSSHAEKVLANYIIAVEGKNNAEAVEIAKLMNRDNLTKAVAPLWNGDTFNWAMFIDGVNYPFINAEADTDVEAVSDKAVLVRDVFCKKATKNSTKAVIDPMLFAMVATLGSNMGVAFVEERKDTIAMLKVYTRFSDAPKCFFSENAQSKTSLNKQLQVIADTMLGKENAVKMLKCHVQHMIDTFIRANADGYKMGNEIALLQVVVNHIADAKNKKQYALDSKLDVHKAPKEKSTK